jgi:7-cyano-7-deazaguanine synthase
MSKAIAIVSGGLDSVTLAHQLHADGHDLHLLAFDYGQRHRRELPFAQACAERLGAAFQLIDLSSLKGVLGGSALTDDIAVPHGHYAAPSMSITIVPNRNAIFLAVAYAAAVAQNAQFVATGVHAGDHFIYPDCRPEFIAAFEAMASVATREGGFRILTPLIHLSKADIAREAQRLELDAGATWSCYDPQAGRPCGVCDSCRLRAKGYAEAGLNDPALA